MPTSEQPPISVVIRAYNEAEKLEKLFLSIEKQSYAGEVQCIVVDNGSTDGTTEVAQKHGAEVVFLAQKDFNYPKSLNLGFAKAKHEIVFSLSGHCVLRGRHYFTRAVSYFNDAKVAGVAGTTLPNHPYTLFEFCLMYSGYVRMRVKGPFAFKTAKSGILQNVCSAIRLSLWKEHSFNEAWAAGGEDVEWGTWVLANGYLAYFDPSMVVYHSHQLGLLAYFKQWKLWKKLETPHAFDTQDLAFRKDIKR